MQSNSYMQTNVDSVSDDDRQQRRDSRSCQYLLMLIIMKMHFDIYSRLLFFKKVIQSDLCMK